MNTGRFIESGRFLRGRYIQVPLHVYFTIFVKFLIYAYFFKDLCNALEYFID